jgi:hypothetical protein
MLGKYKTYWVYMRTDSRSEALNWHRILHFSMENRMGIVSLGQVFSYVRESYLRLREWSFLVIWCRI